MTEPTTVPESDDTPRFDVRVRRDGDRVMDGLAERLVQRARLSPEKAKALTQALQSGNSVVLGRAVTRERADKALALQDAGLVVEVTPVLTLAPKVETAVDGRMECPACGELTELGPERQCGHCGVFVDKVPEEVKLRRQLKAQEESRMAARRQHEAQQEQAKARAALEERLRQQIRDELESQFGALRERNDWRQGLGKPVVAGLALAVMAGAFGAGWGVARGMAPEAGPAVAAKASPAMAAASVPSAEQIDKLLARLDGMASPDDAPAAGGARAMHASASAALPGLGADSLRPGIDVPPQPPETQLANAFAQVDGLPKVDADAAWPADLVPRLRAELAVGLARSGQVQRADELLQTLAPWRASSDPQLASLLRRTRLLVQAWGLQDLSAASAGPRLAAMRESLRELVDPIDRATTLTELLPVLARAPSVSEAWLTSLLQQTAQAVKAVAEEAPRRALAEAWTVAEARSLVARAEREAAQGQFSRLRPRLTALEALLPQTVETATQARLLLMQLRLTQLAGEPVAKVQATWQAALERVTPLGQQAELLREAAQAGNWLSLDELRRQAQRLGSRTDSVQGAARAAGAGELALLWADLGQADQAAQWRQRALQTAGLNADQTLRLRAELVAGAEVALASSAHRVGDFAVAEGHWRRAAAYTL